MPPTVVLGLDGATFTVLDPLLAEGTMPRLRAFIEEGVRAELLSTPHPLTPPAFTTMITGRGPGHHGIFDFMRGGVENDRAFFTLNNYRDIRCETLWTLVSRWGGRIMSLNYPLLAPPPAVAGYIVPGLLSWRHMRRNVYPAELYEVIKGLPGFNADEFSCDIEVNTAAIHMPADKLLAFLRTHVIAADQQWFRILHYLMQVDRCDLTVAIFAGVDKLQHVCWRYLDPAYLPPYLDPTEQAFRDLSVEYFRQLDDILGQIIDLAGPEANIFIVSDHGFGPTERIFHVNKWLEQQGYLKWPPPDPEADRRRRNTHFVHLDWPNTLVYCQSAATNGVHIRVRRHPGDFGVLPEEYLAFRSQLIAKFLALRDPVTGGPFIKDVLCRDDAYPGPFQPQAPDLTLVQFDYGFVSVLNKEPIIDVRPCVIGTHYPAGILLARGPAIASGATLPAQSILDMAPTLLYSLGLPIPCDLDSKVMESLFSTAYRKSHPVTTGPATEPPNHFAAARGDSADAARGDEEILNRLRALGYVE